MTVVDSPGRDVRISRHIKALDWETMAATLDGHGYAVTGPLLSSEECRSLSEAYAEERLFRSRVIMARHGFGRGE